MRRYKVSVTTAADGTVTAYTPRVAGKLHSVIYVPDGISPFANTVDMTITAEATGESRSAFLAQAAKARLSAGA